MSARFKRTRGSFRTMASGMFAIHHVTSVEKTLAFYRALGLAVDEGLIKGTATGLIRAPGSCLVLLPKQAVGQEGRAWVSDPLGNGCVVTFGVDDARATFERARAAGAQVDEPLVEKAWGGLGYKILDPDGYVLNFLERFPPGV